jgi:hypothetical protein
MKALDWAEIFEGAGGRCTVANKKRLASLFLFATMRVRVMVMGRNRGGREAEETQWNPRIKWDCWIRNNARKRKEMPL